MCCADRRGMDGICMTICWRSDVTLNAVDSFTPRSDFGFCSRQTHTNYCLLQSNTNKLVFISIVWHHKHVSMMKKKI